MKRIGLFVDISNLYYCVGKKYPKRKLDYRKYKRFVQDLGEIQQMVAYGAQMSQQAEGFKYCLKQMGFNTKYKTPKVYAGEGDKVKRKADWDVGIAMDMVQMIDRFDMIVLGTGDGDMLPVVEWAMQKGVDVVILASGISKDLRTHATQCIEIPPSLLESPKPKGAKRPNEMAEEKIKKGASPESLHTVSGDRKEDETAPRICEAKGIPDIVDKCDDTGDGNVPDRITPTPDAGASDMGVDAHV